MRTTGCVPVLVYDAKDRHHGYLSFPLMIFKVCRIECSQERTAPVGAVHD